MASGSVVPCTTVRKSVFTDERSRAAGTPSPETSATITSATPGAGRKKS